MVKSAAEEKVFTEGLDEAENPERYEVYEETKLKAVQIWIWSSQEHNEAPNVSHAVLNAEQLHGLFDVNEQNNKTNNDVNDEEDMNDKV